MARVVWTRQAHRHLEEIGEYFLETSSEYTRSLLEALVEAPTILMRFPRAGHVLPETPDGPYRELIFEHFRIVHVIEGDSVFIIGVVHTSREIVAALDRMNQDR